MSTISRQKLIEELESKRRSAEHKVWNEVINMLIHIINRQPPADQWIPCSSGVFPTEKGWYWVTEDWGDGETRLLYYIPKLQGAFEEYIKLKYGGVEVTAWMPAILPEPYKGVE